MSQTGGNCFFTPAELALHADVEGRENWPDDDEDDEEEDEGDDEEESA